MQALCFTASYKRNHDSGIVNKEYINKETNMEVTEKLSQPNSTSTQVGSDKVLSRTTHTTTPPSDTFKSLIDNLGG